jgi:chromosome segregation protein
MHLSKLQLLGFKSFPEKTELVFNKGISCIVGPNGCGKTNLLDAIRWGIGESRMSVLRGSRLEEIIFAGTRDYKPLGMAEISITFDNHDHAVPSGYDEINVTRRLFRSGESEFLINRTPCRLKDITEMFLDTGLAPGAYSVIEQSMVDVILSDKTEDRRFLFEEAAGITKYKQRKRHALRKLESTDADLLRLQDVLAEVGSQVTALKKQVSRAERHRALSDEIKRIGISLSSAEFTALEGRRRTLADELEKLKIESETNSARQKELDVHRERLALEKSEQEQRARELQAELERSISECHRLEREISVLREKQRNAAESSSRAADDVERLLRRGDSIDEELEKYHVSQAETAAKIQSTNTALESVETDLDSRLARAHELKSHHEQLQDDMAKLVSVFSGRRESQLTLDLRCDADAERIVQLDSELASLRSDLVRLEAERKLIASDSERAANEISAKRDDLERIKTLLEDRSVAIEDCDRRRNETTVELERASARLEFLDKVINEYEGYGGGTAAVGQLKASIPGVLDTVANLVEVDPRHTSLIQSVLGDLSGFFVVENDAAASAVLDRVRAQDLGRVGVVVRSRIDGATPSVSIDPPGNSVPVRSLVSGRTDLSRTLDFLFEGHFVAKSDIREISEAHPQLTFWSENGDMVGGSGALASSGSHEVLLVGRLHERDSLQNQINDLLDRMKSLNDEKAACIKQRDELVAESAALDDDIAKRTFDANDLSVKLSSIDYEFATQGTRENEKASARQLIAGSLESLTRDRDALNEEVGGLQSRKAQLENELSENLSALRIADGSCKEAERSCGTLKMELIGLESQLDTLRSNRDRTVELKSDLLETVRQREAQISEYLTAAAESKRATLAHEASLKERYSEEEIRRGDVVSANARIADIDAGIKDLDGELRKLRQAAASLSETIHSIDLDLATTRSRCATVAQEAMERYQFEVASSSLRIVLSEQQMTDLGAQLNDLRERLNGLGPVNLLALDEYEEQSKRFEFLSAQVKDLVAAKDDLKSTITRINGTAKKLFIETLDAVRTNFKLVFQELFEGGDADILLEEEVDPLEANIIVKARPRGKKILSIQQLSGGERALTAISLLFSLYLVKPSPFCILDEVDAPLDDANIGRFLKMIKRFSDNTQFITITHNKLTMEAADILYGVTMKQPGVSQIVSVNLNRRGELEDVLGEGSAVSLGAEETVEAES